MMSRTVFEERFAVHPRDVKNYHTEQLRKEFLIEKVFKEDKILLVYSAYDRFIVGGANPINEVLSLETIDPLKAQHFCDRREIGVINIGGRGIINMDGDEIVLDRKEAFYIGRGARNVSFKSNSADYPAMFYINSAAAHRACPSKKVSVKDAKVLDLGKTEEANKRRIIQYIVSDVVETCQLQMGITELANGSVWNTIPPHTHHRRMEVYFYMDLPVGQTVCHFLGQPKETRHIWLGNNQAVLSPPWSIHSGVATSNYSFIWGMAGENLDFTDMDVVPVGDLR